MKGAKGMGGWVRLSSEQGQLFLQETSDGVLSPWTVSSLTTRTSEDHPGTSVIDPRFEENEVENKNKVQSRLESKNISTTFSCLTVNRPPLESGEHISESTSFVHGVL